MMARWQVVGLSLFAVFFVMSSCCVLGGLGMIWLQFTREQSRMANCVSNLRTLGLGAQNHHDQRADSLPMGMYSGGISWAGLILPYVEQPQMWRQLRFDLPYDAAPNNEAHNLQGTRAAYPFFYCPSRRSPPQLTGGYPAADYVVPSVGRNPALDDPNANDTWMECHAYPDNFGPMLLLYRQPPETWPDGTSSDQAKRYRSQTSFASFVDGTAYQVLFGEKALDSAAFGSDGKGGDFTCYAFIENSFNAAGAARPGNGGIRPVTNADWQHDYRHWGSWHGDVCSFALADGSVRRFNAHGSQKILTAVCNRQDGNLLQWPPEGLVDDQSLMGQVR